MAAGFRPLAVGGMNVRFPACLYTSSFADRCSLFDIQFRYPLMVCLIFKKAAGFRPLSQQLFFAAERFRPHPASIV